MEREERKAENCFIVPFHFYSNFYSKNGARKIPTADESTEKKNHLPVSLHNPFLDVKMENSSSEDLSEVLQQ